jgi:hypothetical protein
VLRAHHSGSLATAIALSLSSPMFRELGPDSRGLLEVVAFFPQGVDEEKVDWLFSTVSDAPHMFDTFCILSLTYRSNGFITMLAPLRDHLRPKDPMTSPLLSILKERYFTRLSTNSHPDLPSFRESRWITSEDVNVEHLLDVFTSVDPDSEDAWDACAHFFNHLGWHKSRLTVLGPKIETLSDSHPSKARCLGALALSFGSIGNGAENKRLHTHTLKLWRERGEDYQVAGTLSRLSDVNRLLGYSQEAIVQAREAMEIFERLGDTVDQAGCFVDLARALYDDNRIDAAEEAALRGIELLRENSKQATACQSHRLLGNIYSRKGETDKAAHHFSESQPLSAYPTTCSGPITPWRRRFTNRISLSPHTTTSNVQCCTPTTHTTSVARRSSGLAFGPDKARSKRQGSRSRAPSTFTGSSGLRMTLSGVGSSSRGLID